MDFKFTNGDKVKDKVTGFEGIVIARHQWLNNCNTYTVKPQTLKDGKTQDSEGFDEPQLILIDQDVLHSPKKKTGGPERSVSQPNRI